MQPKSSSLPRPTNSSGYSQSWVFEAENNSNNTSSPYLKLPQDTDSPLANGRATSPESVKLANEETIIIANPVVHIEEASDESNSNSDRKLCYMKSFSRTPSPAVLSAASSQLSLDQQNPQIYECLEKLTEQSVYRTRLNTALSVKEEQTTGTSPKKSELSSPRSDQVQYASLMVELEQKLSKKEKTKTPESKDDFSKELEAALQLIQDLESPNTGETPSEPEQKTVWEQEMSESEKTLSAVGSLTELSPVIEYAEIRPTINGKLQNIVIQSESQSTSGYSSPTRKFQNWSVNSSFDETEIHKTNFSIKNTSSSAVISLYGNQSNKSVTVIKLHDSVDDRLNERNYVKRSSSAVSSLSPWNVKSLIRRKKSIPRLSAELESAIIKSESLAHLTDLELLARHERNKEIQRVRMYLIATW